MGIAHLFHIGLKEVLHIAGRVYHAGYAEEVGHVELESDIGVDAFRTEEVGDAECGNAIAGQAFVGIFDIQGVTEGFSGVGGLIQVLDELREFRRGPELFLGVRHLAAIGAGAGEFGSVKDHGIAQAAREDLEIVASSPPTPMA